ncbi:MAG: DNA-protecting protein DprA [Candidatus Omnitrophica bacterium]|nr:DNA-protecting protein DprA [Candidatus Omnitrophota bacterium]
MNTNLSSLLCLNQLTLKTRRGILEFLDQGMSALEIRERVLHENLWDSAEKLKAIHFRFDVQKEMEECERLGIRFFTVLDSGYPELLRKIYHPPLVLYVRGEIFPEDRHAIAVVGTRHPSFYGIEQTRRFVRDLTQKGLTIVSGLAKGIDHAAHEAALEISHGRTIGILGCGPDLIYPPGSESLYEKIAGCGAVISEYPLGTQPLAHHFPQRNRIIAGLSHGVLVVEAHHRSGALITAHEAIEEGRDVFAIPGPVNQLTSRGTHRLLKEGAYLVESPEDVMEVIAASILMNSVQTPLSPCHPERNERSQDELGEESKSETLRSVAPHDDIINEDDQKLLELLKTKSITSDEWIEISGMESWKAMIQLTLLEIKKKVIKQSDGTFKLA